MYLLINDSILRTLDLRCIAIWASLVVPSVKNESAVHETKVQSLGQENLLEKEMATQSSILAWEIPWTEERVRLQSIESQTVYLCYYWKSGDNKHCITEESLSFKSTLGKNYQRLWNQTIIMKMNHWFSGCFTEARVGRRNKNALKSSTIFLGIWTHIYPEKTYKNTLTSARAFGLTPMVTEG